MASCWKCWFKLGNKQSIYYSPICGCWIYVLLCQECLEETNIKTW